MRNNEVRRAGVGEQWRVELSTNLRGVSHCTEKALLGPSPCWKCLQVWWNGFIRSFIIKDRKKFLVTAQLREGLLTLTGVVARCDLIKLSHNGPHSSHSSPQLTVAHPSSPHCTASLPACWSFTPLTTQHYAAAATSPGSPDQGCKCFIVSVNMVSVCRWGYDTGCQGGGGYK